MSASGFTPTAHDELRELYARYKRLSLGSGASLVLGEPMGSLAEHAALLLADSHAALAGADAAFAPAFGACVRASDDLHALLVSALGDAAQAGTVDAERVRESHKRLRREVWKVVPLEYVPCSMAGRDDHRHERR